MKINVHLKKDRTGKLIDKVIHVSNNIFLVDAEEIPLNDRIYKVDSVKMDLDVNIYTLYINEQ